MSVAIMNLEPGTEYVVRVTAVNTIGQSEGIQKDGMWTKTNPATFAPQPATGIRASEVRQTQAKVSWEAPLPTGGAPIYETKVKATNV
jgi:hypothetical protein